MTRFLLAATAAVAAATVAAATVAAAAATTNASLVIYTYQSIFQSGNGLDWIEMFSNYSGVSNSSINVQFFDDANAILSSAQNPAPNVPAPDVLLGVDNVLQLEAVSSLATPYNSSLASNLLPGLLSSVTVGDNNDLSITPYDFSYITLTVNMTALKSISPDAFNLFSNTSNPFTLKAFLDNPQLLFPLLVLPNPITSGTGINFLAFLVASFGDPASSINGTLTPAGDWRQFYQLAYKYNTVITSSWSDGFYDYFSNSMLKYPIIASYSTDAPYDECQFSNTTLKTFGNGQLNGTPYAWRNIEGISIMSSVAKNNTKLTLAKQFVDFILTQNFQSELPLNDYTYPAVSNVSLPTCYNVNPSYQPINSYLPISKLQANIKSWLSDVGNILQPSSVPSATPSASLLPSSSPVSPSPSHSPSTGTSTVPSILVVGIFLASLFLISA